MTDEDDSKLGKMTKIEEIMKQPTPLIISHTLPISRPIALPKESYLIEELS